MHNPKLPNIQMVLLPTVVGITVDLQHALGIQIGRAICQTKVCSAFEVFEYMLHHFPMA